MTEDGVVQNLGLDWDERVLPSIGNEIVKAAVAQYNAEQLLTQRDRVSRAVSVQACSFVLSQVMWYQLSNMSYGQWQILSADQQCGAQHADTRQSDKESKGVQHPCGRCCHHASVLWHRGAHQLSKADMQKCNAHSTLIALFLFADLLLCNMWLHCT